MSMRHRLYGRLGWCTRQIDLTTLSDLELGRLNDWVETQLAETRRCRVPGASLVAKERRRGNTGKVGWRYVVYVGDVGSPVEVAVLDERRAAYEERRRQHAKYWMAHIDGRPWPVEHRRVAAEGLRT